MATIGTFTEKDGELICKIQTLNINVSLAFLSNQNRPSPEAPAYRVFAGRSDLGAAWEKTSDNTGRTYCSVPLDDPTFAAPFFANLVEQNQGGFALIWSRAQRRDGDGRGRWTRPATSAHYPTTSTTILRRCLLWVPISRASGRCARLPRARGMGWI